MIYQDELGGDNTGKIPKGGVIFQSSTAKSMGEAIENSITFYYAGSVVINQSGHSKDLYNYYWSSYSRGTDGRRNGSVNEPQWHNVYLDGYIPLRVKSIYDPCPYLYRIPSNGTYNQFTLNEGWTGGSYLGGNSWNMNPQGESWFTTGIRNGGSNIFEYIGIWGDYYVAIASSGTTGTTLEYSSGVIYKNYIYYGRSAGISVRCIEEARNM